MPESQEESLVYDDFSFLNYDSQQDKDLVIDHVKAIFYFDGQNQPEEITTALYEIWKNQFENANANEQVGFICRSLSDEFAGCITTSPISKSHINTMVLSSFFVPEQFRGLGIATELLTMCLSKLKKDGKRWIILPNIITPEILQPLLYRMGFEKIESGYVSKL
jgi:GNAT superfamily N-acetyltransferase